MWPLEAINPEFCDSASSSFRIHHLATAPVSETSLAARECLSRYAFCPMTVRRMLVSLLLGGYSHTSRPLTVTPSGNRKYRVLRLRAIYREGLVVPSVGCIVSPSVSFPSRTTIVPCDLIGSGLISSST